MGPRSVALWKAAPIGFFHTLVDQLFEIYPTGEERSKGIHKHLRPNVSGVVRWGFVETEFFKVAQSFNIESVWKPNERASSHHVEVRIGKFLLTISKVDEPATLPHDADFRSTLIEASQSRLFDDILPKGKFIYAPIVHTPTEDRHEPDHVHILFPDQDGVIVECVDLLDATSIDHPALVPESIEDDLHPTLNAETIRKIEGAKSTRRKSS